MNEATNRKIRRLMHRENRKLVDSAKKQWEMTVSKLVAFMKRRDPRWMRYAVERDRVKQDEVQREIAMKQEIAAIMREEVQRQRTAAMENRQSESGMICHV